MVVWYANITIIRQHQSMSRSCYFGPSPPDANSPAYMLPEKSIQFMASRRLVYMAKLGLQPISSPRRTGGSAVKGAIWPCRPPVHFLLELFASRCLVQGQMWSQTFIEKIVHQARILCLSFPKTPNNGFQVQSASLAGIGWCTPVGIAVDSHCTPLGSASNSHQRGPLHLKTIVTLFYFRICVWWSCHSTQQVLTVFIQKADF